MRALLILILLLPFYSFAQKEGDNWTFTDSIGLKFDVQNDNISLYKTYLPFLYFGESECQATISDSSGNLLFYFKEGINQVSNVNQDTFNVLSRGGGGRKGDNTLITNGDSLFNNPSSTNGAIFLRHPLNLNKTFLFNLSSLRVIIPGNTNVYDALFVNTIDIDSQKVVSKNQLLYKCLALDEKIAAVRHANGRDWWLFIFDRENGRFVRFLMDENGVNGPEFQEIPDSVIIHQHPYFYVIVLGEMVFSRQGDQLAFQSLQGRCVLFDFDRCTGLFSNPKFYTAYSDAVQPGWGPCGAQPCVPYSCAFSPDGSKLYTIDGALDSLLQYDLIQPDLLASRKLIYKFTTNLDHHSLGQLENGPDGRVYFTTPCNLCSENTTPDVTNYRYLHAIDHPDRLGDACGLHLNKIYLNGHKAGAGLPAMPNWRLKGLPFANAGGDPYRRCGGDSVRIGAPRQSCQYYKWALAPGLNPADTAAANPKVAPDITTTYTLTTWIDGSDEISVDSVTVFVTAFANGYITAAPDTFSAGPFTVHFAAAGADTTGLTFNWDFGDQQTGTNAITSHTYDALDGYHVKLFAQSQDGACKDTFAYYLKLTLITGVSEIKEGDISFRFYPNPAREQVSIDAVLPQGETARIDVSDVKGSQIASYEIENGQRTLDVHNWAPGIYHCRVLTQDGKQFSTKLVILK